MNERGSMQLAAAGLMTVVLAGCAVRPIPDPRSPASVRDAPVVLRVCYVDGGGAHLAVGDQVELATSSLGRLRIRHLPANNGPAWNAGEDVAVKDAVLVEQVGQRPDSKNLRRFVPVGRFAVQIPDGSHTRFDFLASKAVANLANNRFSECNVPLGADEVLIRGVEDEARHGGHAILR
jgi:hypothetical protein